MGHSIEAIEIVLKTAERLGLPSEEVITLFGDTPLDFPIISTNHLPLFADRFGMIGITINGRVWILEKGLSLSPIELLRLIRHEAEHVKQQRQDPFFFYLRYGGEWVLNYCGLRSRSYFRQMCLFYSRSAASYRTISYEQEAYTAGDGLRLYLRDRKEK